MRKDLGDCKARGGDRLSCPADFTCKSSLGSAVQGMRLSTSASTPRLEACDHGCLVPCSVYPLPPWTFFGGPTMRLHVILSLVDTPAGKKIEYQARPLSSAMQKLLRQASLCRICLMPWNGNVVMSQAASRADTSRAARQAARSFVLCETLARTNHLCGVQHGFSILNREKSSWLCVGAGRPQHVDGVAAVPHAACACRPVPAQLHHALHR